jgi:hypothetical protein
MDQTMPVTGPLWSAGITAWRELASVSQRPVVENAHGAYERGALLSLARLQIARLAHRVS